MGLKKIGFYGGSFDPFHFGHLNLLIELKEFHQLDEVWICPTFISPFKREANAALPHHRLAMIKCAIAPLSFVKAIDHEIQRQDVSYTIDTLQELEQTLYANGMPSQLYLMLGDDALLSLTSWKKIEEIIKYYPLLIGSRSRNPLNFLPDKPCLRNAIEKGLTKTTLMEVSATQIRDRIKKKLYCEHLLPTKVLDYINYHRLYH